MAGEAVKTIAQSPDIFQYKTFGPYAAADLSADLILPFLCPDYVVIDQVSYSYTVVGGASAAVRLYRGVPTASTEVTTAHVITAARDITSAMDLTAAVCVLRDATISVTSSVPDNNILNPGNIIVLDQSGTLGSLAGLLITIRYRTRLDG